MPKFNNMICRLIYNILWRYQMTLSADLNYTIYALVFKCLFLNNLTYGENKHLGGCATSQDMMEAFSGIKRINDYFLAKEINPDICPDISEILIGEIKAFKWIESEKAGRNLWEYCGKESNQIVEAGKIWFEKYWNSFKQHYQCNCH